MSEQQLAEIAGLIGKAKPATDALLVQLGESVRDRLAHDHSTQREDWYCMNLTSFMGERMGPVLRRLLDSEAEVQRLREERHSTNEALDDAVRELRAQRDRVAELEALLSDLSEPDVDGAGRTYAEYHPPTERSEDVSPQVAKLRGILARQRRQQEDPHDGPLASRYTTPHNLPEVTP
ncbi:hypothetical protein ACFUGD_02025 [Streptomyces sp. NPDC057217]|uniref:hypothetical protein n=1 Tax=Streptomyces sp. NPDC057217 TaxID=3346054 RepID=UPI003635A04C